MVIYQVPYPPYVPTDAGPDWVVNAFVLLGTLVVLWAVLDAEDDEDS